MRLIDVHSHLEWPSFISSMDKVIDSAKKAGLVSIISSSIDLKSAQLTLDLSENYKNYVFASVGFSPSETAKRPKTFQSFLDFAELNLEKFIALGEVGLDYYWIRNKDQRKFSEKCFIQSIYLAEKLNKPLTIHCRDAEKNTIEILEEYSSTDKIHMHCFSGSSIHIKRCVKNGWMFSVPTSVVNRKSHQKLAKEVPLERMMLETDAPFLSPLKSEKRNEPKNIEIAVKYIANMKNINVEELAEITTQNAIDFFSLKLN